jgi:hypothetical protein
MGPEITISMTAVLVAVVANFLFGWLYYGPLFGKTWAAEMKMDMTKKPPSSVMIRGMLMMLIGGFLMVYVFAHNIFVWNHFMGDQKPGVAQNAFAAAFFTFLGFYLPQHLSKVAWEGSSWKLFFINCGHNLIGLFIVALILICTM